MSESDETNPSNEFALEHSPQWCISANLRIMTRWVDTIYRKHLKAFGITESQLHILMVIEQYAPLPQSQIGRILQLERSTVSRDLQRLLSRNLVHKTHQGRRSLLVLSPFGVDFVQDLKPHWDQAMTEVKALLGSQGYAAFVDMMKAVHQRR